jgi:glutathione S-transferase
VLTLYHARGSNSMAAHIALHEIGARFEMRALSFARRETREPWLLAIDPAGKVPVLVTIAARAAIGYELPAYGNHQSKRPDRRLAVTRAAPFYA